MYELDNRGEDELCRAAKLMELIILSCPARIDDVCVRPRHRARHAAASTCRPLLDWR